MTVMAEWVEAQLRQLEMWRTAALLKDRTRRSLRERYTAGETTASIASDYGIPVAFVEALCAPQLFGS